MSERGDLERVRRSSRTNSLSMGHALKLDKVSHCIRRMWWDVLSNFGSSDQFLFRGAP